MSEVELSNVLQLLWACMKSSALTVRDGNKKSRTGNHKILFLSPASLSLDRSKRAGREEENVAFLWQGNVQTVWTECVRELKG